MLTEVSSIQNEQIIVQRKKIQKNTLSNTMKVKL